MTDVEKTHPCKLSREGVAGEDYCRVMNRRQATQLDACIACASPWRFCPVCIVERTLPIHTLRTGGMCPVHNAVGNLTKEEVLARREVPHLAEELMLAPQVPASPVSTPQEVEIPLPRPTPVRRGRKPRPQKPRPLRVKTPIEELSMGCVFWPLLEKIPSMPWKNVPNTLAAFEADFEECLTAWSPEESVTVPISDVVSAFKYAMGTFEKYWCRVMHPADVIRLVALLRSHAWDGPQIADVLGASSMFVTRMNVLAQLHPKLLALLDPRIQMPWRIGIETALKIRKVPREKQFTAAQHAILGKVKSAASMRVVHELLAK